LTTRIGWPYIDNDVLLERLRGMTARQTLAATGVEELREHEAHALMLGLDEPEPCFIGAAAGTVLDQKVRAAMSAKAMVVWLDANPATLARRARGAPHRPWLDDDAEAWMRATLAERAPLYKSVADLIVNTQRRRPASIADQIIYWLGDQPGCMRLITVGDP
jgi:shikimate kinase